MTFLWILAGIVYIACWMYLGLASFREGHYWLFWIGFVFPILWIIGAFIAPTDRAAARAAGLRLGGCPGPANDRADTQVSLIESHAHMTNLKGMG